MIGHKGITVVAFASSDGCWRPYLLYKNGPYPGTKGPPKGWDFIAIIDGDKLLSRNAMGGKWGDYVHQG